MKWLLSAIALCCVTVASAEQSISRIAFGSCAMQTKAQPIWDVIADQKPDLFLFIGDAIYSDYDGEKAYTPTEVTLERDWGKLAEEKHFRSFRQQVPIMATWDNHDYGSHDGGEAFELKELTKKYFLDFFDEPQDSDRRTTPGIYHARVFGPVGKRVQLILLDTRWFKGAALRDDKRSAGQSGSMGKYLPNDDPDVTLLGDAQWKWLEQQLKQPAELRLIVSSTQVVADQKQMDEWGNYPLERKRLFGLIKQTEANGVLLLSGNVHFTELSKLETAGLNVFDFTSSGLTHSNPAYAAVNNPYRVAGPYDGLNFGLVEIDWGAEPSPLIHLVAMGINGETVYEYTLALSELNQY